MGGLCKMLSGAQDARRTVWAWTQPGPPESLQHLRRAGPPPSARACPRQEGHCCTSEELRQLQSLSSRGQMANMRTSRCFPLQQGSLGPASCLGCQGARRLVNSGKGPLGCSRGFYPGTSPSPPSLTASSPGPPPPSLGPPLATGVHSTGLGERHSISGGGDTSGVGTVFLPRPIWRCIPSFTGRTNYQLKNQPVPSGVAQ